MSHHTGATFAVLLFQTTELMNAFKQPRPAQAMNKVVPTFQARGTMIKKNPAVNQTKGKEGLGRKYLLDANTAE